MIAGYLQQVVDTLVEARDGALSTEVATGEAAAEFAAALIQANAIPSEPRPAPVPDAAIPGEGLPVARRGTTGERSPEPSLPPLMPSRDIAGRTEVAPLEGRTPLAAAPPAQSELGKPVLQPNAEAVAKNDAPAELDPMRSLPPIEGRGTSLPIPGEAPRREPARPLAPEHRVERAKSEVDSEASHARRSARPSATESTPLRDEPEIPGLNLREGREGAAPPTTPVDRSWIPERSAVALPTQPAALGPVESARNPAPSLPPEGASRVVQDVSWLASRGGGQARVRLHPPELGAIELSVRVRNQDVEITIRAQDSRALVALTDSKDLLLEGLAGRDLRAAQLQIVRSGTDESPATRDGDSRSWNDAPGDRSGSDRGQHDAENRSRSPRALGVARPADVPVNHSVKPLDESAPSRGAVDIRI